MPSGNEELIIRGSDGHTYIVTSTGGQVPLTTGTYIATALAGFLISTTADPGSPVTGQIWFRSDV